MNMNQIQLRAFLGGFGLTAIILLTASAWAVNQEVEPAHPPSIQGARS